MGMSRSRIASDVGLMFDKKNKERTSFNKVCHCEFKSTVVSERVSLSACICVCMRERYMRRDNTGFMHVRVQS